MADLIKLKRSATPSAVPTAAQLEPGELAINTADGRVYLKKEDGTVVTVNPEVDGGASLTVVVVTGTTQAVAVENHYVLTNVAATALTLPASPPSGGTVWVTVANGLSTNSIARNGQTIMGLAEDLTINRANVTVLLRFVNGTWRLV